MTTHRIPYDTVKRGLDVVASGVGLVLSAPIQGAVAIAVRSRLGSPVIFRQDRPGRDGKIFRLYKFRTMKDVDEAAGLVTDADRLTPFGVWLRSTSLDELPTLWNVFTGDMSIVGPRPLLVRYLDRYTPTQARRHEVRPGITGLAQASGRNEVEWDEKFRLDVQYIDTRSLRVDASIIVSTIRSLISRTGISAEGHATMYEFGAERTGGSMT